MNAADQRLQNAMTNSVVNHQPMGIDLRSGDVYMDNAGGIRRHENNRSINAGSLVAKQDTKLALVITGSQPDNTPSPAPLSIDCHGRIVTDGTPEPHNARAANSTQTLSNGHVVAHMDTKLA